MSVFTRNKDFQSFFRRFPAVVLLTLAIIIIQLLTYFYGNGPTNLETARRYGAIQPEDTSPDEWFRLAAYLFVQIGGSFHLLANVSCLLIFGPPLERIYGSAKFIFLFFATGMVGGLFILLFSINVLAAGASGSIFGLMGLYLGLIMKKSKVLDSASKNVIWSAFIGNIIYTFAVPNISIAAHLGGLVGGIILSLFVQPQSYRGLRNSKLGQTIVQILVATSLWFSFLSFPKYLSGSIKIDLTTKIEQAKAFASKELGLFSSMSIGKSSITNGTTSTQTAIINDVKWANDKYNQVYPIMNEVINYYNEGISSETQMIQLFRKIEHQQEVIFISKNETLEKSFHTSMNEQQSILLDIFTKLNEAADYCKLVVSSNYQDEYHINKFQEAIDEIDIQASIYQDSLISLYEQEDIQWTYNN